MKFQLSEKALEQEKSISNEDKFNIQLLTMRESSLQWSMDEWMMILDTFQWFGRRKWKIKNDY